MNIFLFDGSGFNDVSVAEPDFYSSGFLPRKEFAFDGNHICAALSWVGKIGEITTIQVNLDRRWTRGGQGVDRSKQVIHLTVLSDLSHYLFHALEDFAGVYGAHSIHVRSPYSKTYIITALLLP